MKTDTLLAGLLAAGMTLTKDVTVDWIGVPVNVLFCCFVGSLMSFGIPDKSKLGPKQFWITVAMCVSMGAGFTAICNAVVGHFTTIEMTSGFQAGIGLVVSFTMRFALPWMADAISKGRWLKWIPIFRGDNKPEE